MENLKKNKVLLIVVGIVFLLLMCCGLSLMFAGDTDITEDQETTSESTTTQTLEPTEKEIKAFINAKDFQKKEYSTIVSKYGEPSWKYDAEAPVVTNFGYEDESYELQANFLSNDTRVFGGTIFYKNITCKYDNFSFETASEALEYAGLDNLVSEDWEHKTTILTDRYEVHDVDGWDRIYVDCSDDNQFSVAFQAVGWDQR